MHYKEWSDANSKLFKEPHDAAVHKISYEIRLYELISASLILISQKVRFLPPGRKNFCKFPGLILRTPPSSFLGNEPDHWARAAAPSPS